MNKTRETSAMTIKVSDANELTSHKLYWIEDQLADVSTRFYTLASWTVDKLTGYPWNTHPHLNIQYSVEENMKIWFFFPVCTESVKNYFEESDHKPNNLFDKVTPISIEFVQQSRASSVGNPFLYYCDLYIWLKGDTVRRN